MKFVFAHRHHPCTDSCLPTSVSAHLLAELMRMNNFNFHMHYAHQKAISMLITHQSSTKFSPRFHTVVYL